MVVAISRTGRKKNGRETVLCHTLQADGHSWNWFISHEGKEWSSELLAAGDIQVFDMEDIEFNGWIQRPFVCGDMQIIRMISMGK